MYVHPPQPGLSSADLIKVCISCMEEYLPRSNSCPLCRHNINQYSLLELPPDTSEWVEPEEVPPVKSAKIAELIKYLKVFDPNDKTLVFSQFTSFLDHVAAGLKEEGIQFCRFDGSMNSKQVSLSTRSLA